MLWPGTRAQRSARKEEAMKTIALAAFAAVTLVGAPAFAEDAAKEGAKPPAKKPEPQITVEGAKTEEETKARLRADAAMQRCVIKPVMTDEEIQLCTTASRMRRELVR
jgi:hypothetical protein